MLTPLSVRITPSYAMPMDLEKLKIHLKVDGTEEDAYITDLAIAASVVWEERVRQAVMEAEYVAVGLNWAAAWDGLRVPITGITKVEYLGESGEAAELGSGYAASVLTPGVVYFSDYRNLPTLSRTAAETVRVYYTAGATTVENVPPLVQQFIRLVVGHWYENRQEVVIGAPNSAEIPMGAQSLINLEREPVL